MYNQYMFDNKWLEYGIVCAAIVIVTHAWVYRSSLGQKVREYLSKYMNK